MTPVEHNLAACARCQRWDRSAPGAILCTVNGRRIGDNARAGTCPLDAYASFVPPPSPCRRKWRGLGDLVAALTRVTGLAAAARLWSTATGRPCGCEPRINRLNKLWPFKPE